MFFPDGYLPLLDVIYACSQLAAERFPDITPDDFSMSGRDKRALIYGEMLFDRFLDAHKNDIWVFKYPDTLLRVSPEFLARSHIYDGTCPTEVGEAELALEHIAKGPRIGLSFDMRVDATIPADCPPEAYRYLEDLRPLHGAILCWKIKIWPVDVEKEVSQFLDHIYWRGVPEVSGLFSDESDDAEGLSEVYQAFLKFCPDGK